MTARDHRPDRPVFVDAAPPVANCQDAPLDLDGMRPGQGPPRPAAARQADPDDWVARAFREGRWQELARLLPPAAAPRFADPIANEAGPPLDLDGLRDLGAAPLVNRAANADSLDLDWSRGQRD